MQKQFGRSMVEMLGVLAIIGVLSIGGILGYRIAVNKYQANQILDDVNRFAFTIIERSPLSDGEISSADFVKTSPYTITAENDAEENYFYVEVHDVPKGVCHELVNKKSDDFEIYAGTQGNYLYQGDGSICDGTNRMLFVFGDVDELCKHTPGEGEQACVHGCVCDGACLTDVKTGEKVCCDNNTQKACNGACYDECDENHRFDNDSCSCECFPISYCSSTLDDTNCTCSSCSDNRVLDTTNKVCCTAKTGCDSYDTSCNCSQCNTSAHFVTDNAGGCQCDSANNWTSDGAGGCTCAEGYEDDGNGGCKLSCVIDNCTTPNAAFLI